MTLGAAGSAVPWREVNASEFSATVGTAAAQLDLQPLAVEKDYWVCQALGAMAASRPGALVFKGGTSLEKLRLIQRLSEDLDLLVVAEFASNSAPKTAMKELCSVAAAAVGQLGDDVDKGRSRGSPGSFSRSQYIKPPLTFEPLAGTALADPGQVLIELGQSGGDQPSLDTPVTSLLARQLQEVGGVDIDQYPDLRPFSIAVLHPGRTLIEKLLRMNSFSAADSEEGREKRGGWSRIGRQFYDVWGLLGSPQVREFLEDDVTVARVLIDCLRVSAQFSGDAPVPVGGFAASGVFTGVGVDLGRLRREHDLAMAQLYYGPRPGPTFDAVLERVATHRHLLDVGN